MPRRIRLFLWPLTCLLGGISACTEVNTEPVFEEIPQIAFKSISTDTVYQTRDSVVIYVSYQDGDGDLGEPDPDLPSIFIQDSRLAKADELHLAPLAPVGEKVSIQGEIRILLPDLFILGNGSQQKTRMKVWFTDRAGNKSNEIETPDITILKL